VLLYFFLGGFQYLTGAEIHDFIEEGALYFTYVHAVVILYADHFRVWYVLIDAASGFYFEALCTAIGDLEGLGDVLGDVVSTKGHAAGGGDHAVFIEDVIYGACAKVEHEGALVLGLTIEHYLGCGNGIEHDVFYIQGDVPHTADGVLDAAAYAVYDVVVRFQRTCLTAYGLLNCLLAVYDELAGDAVEKNVGLGDGYSAGDLFGLFYVVLCDFWLVLWEAEAAFVVDAFNVGTGYAKEDVADHDITAVLCADEGVIEAGLNFIKVQYLSFAHSA
jgi:hypothetical protein